LFKSFPQGKEFCPFVIAFSSIYLEYFDLEEKINSPVGHTGHNEVAEFDH